MSKHLKEINSLYEKVVGEIGIGFCQSSFYKPHVWRQTKEVMEVLVKAETVVPYNLGRGKGKYLSNIECFTTEQHAQRYLIAKYNIVYGIDSFFIPVKNEYEITGEESFDVLLEKLDCEDIAEVAEMISEMFGFSEPYHNPVAQSDGIVFYHDGESFYIRKVKAGENWLPAKYEAAA